MKNRTTAALIAMALGAQSSVVLAAGLGQHSQVLEEVVVTAEQKGSLTAVSEQASIENLKKIPGGVGFVAADDFLDNFTQSIGDTLVFTPGVFADTSAQRENRISIRGSGLNATFERRGLTVLRDGVPVSRASGITEFQEIDPLSIQHIEVFKGANGLRYGSSSLGGAINIVTPTGKTRKAGTTVRVEAGSFETARSSISTSGDTGKVDYYGAVTRLDSDGFRDHAEVDSVYSFGNVGFSLADNIETRFFVTALQDDFELAGSLSFEDALDNPKQTRETNIVDDQDRNLDVYRLSNRTVISLSQIDIEAAAWFTKRTLDHALTPFVGIIDQEEEEWGISTQVSGEFSLVGFDEQWIVGINHAQSDNDAEVYENILGEKGALSSDDDQDAENTVIYAQLDSKLSQHWNLVLGFNYVDSERTNRNVFAEPAFPGGPVEDDSGSISYDEFSTRIGLLYSPSDNIQYFVNVSEGYEPPGITDLTSGGALPFTELLAQESITYEIGSRGFYKAIAWDIAAYRSEVENEFIDVAAPGFFGGTTVTNTENAQGDTIHQGLEIGVDVDLLSGLVGNAGNLRLRNILTYNDFKFDDDPVNGNNTLAGVPEVVYVAELRYDHGETWYAGLNMRHVANGAYVDYANTFQAPGYQLWGLTAGWNINSSTKVFGSIENIADEEFISNVSTVANLSTEGNQRVFTPGEGRSAYVGVSFSF